MSSSETMMSFESSNSSYWSTSSTLYSVDSRNKAHGQIRLSTLPQALSLISGPKPQSKDPTSFEDALKELRSFTSSSLSDTSISLYLLPSVFNQIVDNLGDYPEFDNFHFDYKLPERLLIIHFPNVGHEVIAELESTISSQKPDDVKFGGTCLILLCNGRKSPDFSIFSDRNPNRSLRFAKNTGTGQIMGYPPVVIEVGYSEKLSDLSEDCGRWIVCSLGRVHLAIGIDVSYKMKTDKDTGEIEHTLTSVNCYAWQVEKVDKHTLLLPGEKVNILKRDAKTSGPQSHFSCVQRVGSSLYRVHAFCRHIYQVFPVLPSDRNRPILIRNKHLYRFPIPEWKPADWDPHAIVFELKMEDILHTVRSVASLQVLSDQITTSLKRKREGEDEFDEWDRQHIRREVDTYEMGLPATP